MEKKKNEINEKLKRNEFSWVQLSSQHSPKTLWQRVEEKTYKRIYIERERSLVYVAM